MTSSKIEEIIIFGVIILQTVARGVVLYFHTYVGAGNFFLVQNFEFHVFFRFFRKMNIFWVWRFCGYFWGSSQN